MKIYIFVRHSNLITDHIMTILLTLTILYCGYQYMRNNEIHKIRQKWIFNNDPRYLKYTYSDMFNPSSANGYGLKFPKDADYSIG